MIFLFVLLPIFVVTSLLSLVVRALFGGFGFRRRGLFRQPRGSWINGSGYGYGNSFGYGRRRGFGGPVLSILAALALERLFTRRG